MARRDHRYLSTPHMRERTPGKCRWCGEPILDKNGKTEKRRLWHPACLGIFLLANHSQTQRNFLDERDHGVCAECGRDTRAMLTMFQCTTPDALDHFSRCRSVEALHARRERYRWLQFLWYESCKLAGKIRNDMGNPHKWEADHIIPLWKCNGEAEFFSAKNLQTLCVPCHRAKSKREAGERAASKRPQLELSV